MAVSPALITFESGDPATEFNGGVRTSSGTLAGVSSGYEGPWGLVAPA